MIGDKWAVTIYKLKLSDNREFFMLKPFRGWDIFEGKVNSTRFIIIALVFLTQQIL